MDGENFVIQRLNGVPFRLAAPFDFSFIRRFGEVFKVFDDQDSGNICFGVRDGEERRFVKFAGAPTARGGANSERAIADLKRAVSLYRALAHPNLIELISSEDVGGGFAAVFKWVNGACMGRQYPEDRRRFFELSQSDLLAAFDDILAFQAHVSSKGYVAIDFYDGGVIYDFEARRAFVCDIDFYAKLPYVNAMGRMWGSSRFMSPEEYELGAEIDEVTNVYTMGATAFALFGGERDRGWDKWRLGRAAYSVALRAVSDRRGERQKSIAEFIGDWRAAARQGGG